MDHEEDFYYSADKVGDRLKKHESIREPGYNNKSGAASARLRQLKKRQNDLRRRLKK